MDLNHSAHIPATFSHALSYPLNLNQQIGSLREKNKPEYCDVRGQKEHLFQDQFENAEAEKPFFVQFPTNARQSTLDLYPIYQLPQKQNYFHHGSNLFFYPLNEDGGGSNEIEPSREANMFKDYNWGQDNQSQLHGSLLQKIMLTESTSRTIPDKLYSSKLLHHSTFTPVSSAARNNDWILESKQANNLNQKDYPETNTPMHSKPSKMWSEEYDNCSNSDFETMTIDYLPTFLSHRSQLSSILDAFTLISGKASLKSDLSKDLILSHQRQKPMDKSILMSQLSMIASTLAEFATSQFLFTSLNREDQAILLKANIPLYLQYILARYFTSETGLEQLNWILDGQIMVDSIEVISSLTRISLQQYNESVDLFSTSEMVDLYSHLSSNVGLFYPFPQHCNGLIANMLLYHTDESIQSHLKEKNRIVCIFNEAKELVKLGFHHLDREMGFDAGESIGPLINSLSKMNKLFGMCRVQARALEFDQTVPKQLEINYTSAEELWMKQKLGDFETEYKSVAPSKDYFEEMVNLLINAKEVSKTFVASWMGMETERVRRVLKMHPEFLSLSDRDQETLWRKNHTSATALGVIRINILTSGKEQFKHNLGILNPLDTEWENQYKDSIDLDAFNSNYLHNREINNGRLDPASITCYMEVVKELSQFCHNVQVYQLFVLLTLLDVDDLGESASFIDILKMRQTYLKIFQRKLASVGCSFIDYAHFRRALKKVKIMANLMENFII